MKHSHLAVLLITLSLFLVWPLMSCLSAAPQPGGSGSEATAKAPAKSDWDNLVAAAKAEGQLVIYAGSIGESRDAIAAAFPKKYGIPIDFVTGRGAELLQKIVKERSAGIYQVDVSFQGMTTFFNQMQAMDITVPLEPLLVLPEVKDPTKWRGGKLPFEDQKKTVAATSATAAPYVVINTDMVKEGEITSNDDLLNPKWKGKIVINDPSVAGNGAEWFTYIMLVAYPKEKAQGYVKKLIAQEPVVVRDVRQQAEWVAKGKYPISLACDQPEVVRMITAGAPIKFVQVKEGSPITSGAQNVMIIDKAPHPNAAKLFINWALSKEGGEVISPSAGYPALRTDISNDKFDPILIPRPDDILPGEDYNMQKGPLQKMASDLFKSLMQ